MKRLLFLILFIPFLVKGQSISQASVQFSTLSDLRAQAGTVNVQVLLNGLTSATDNNGGIYMWNATSTAADDGFLTIAVTGVSTGRWVRMGNSNTIKGTSLLSGAALTTAYTINFGTTLPFVPITVLTEARSANAAVSRWVSTITNSSFTINFSSVPVLGTNNIQLDWVVVKQ